MQASNALMAAVLLATVALVNSWMALQNLKPHPEHPNACYDPETEEAHPLGSTWLVPGQCMEVTCDRSANNFQLQFVGCGSQSVSEPCYMVTDETALFPDCCPKPVCP